MAIEVSKRERDLIEKRLREIRQSKDLAYEMAITDKGASIKKLEDEERALSSRLKSIDNPVSYVNIQSEGKENDITGSKLGATGHGGRSGTGTEIHGDVSSGRVPGTQEEGQITESHHGEGKRSQEAGGESHPDRNDRTGGMGAGTPGNGGVNERLTPAEKALIPGEIKTSSPRDINLNLSTNPIPRTASERWNANMDALRVLKIIESDKRQATPEEQAILSRYSGFGDSAFGKAFDPPYHSSYDRNPQYDPYEKRGEELKELVTPEEFNSIKASRTNAFYTTPEVVKAMWAGLEQMGATKLAHPRILEPSAGSGRFLGFEPTELAARSIRTAVEKDTLTGRILKNAYPDTEVHISGFEDAPIPDNSQDIAISNVPFGNFAIHDNSPEYSKKSGRAILKRSIHNYFFAKSLDKLRPGGIIAFVTSHSTLDAPTAKPIRELLADQADFISATRLPNNAFGDTKVVTDIIYMRKRVPGEPSGDRSWVNTEKINLPATYKNYYGGTETTTQKTDINSYFIQHPEQVLGKHTIGEHGGMYGAREYTVEPLNPKETLSPEAINNAVTRVPVDILKDVNLNEVKPAAIKGTYGLEGSRHVADDGTIVITRNNSLTSSGLSASDTERVKGMLAVRDAGRNVLNIQLRDGTDEEIETAQLSLNAAYDKFTSEYGALNNQHNAELMKDDPDGPFLKALEKPNIKINKDSTEIGKEKYKKFKSLYTAPTLTKEQLKDIQMPIFTGRVVKGLAKHSAATESDATVISLNETGRLDPERMSELTGKDKDVVIQNLAKQGIIFKNPVGDWEPRDKYLSGDVREKLKTAELAAKANPAYKTNVDALRAVQPADIPPSQIGVVLGTPWIPEKDVDDFVHELLGVPREETLESRRDWRNRDNPIYKPLFHYRPDNGEWIVDGSPIKLMRSGNEAKMINEYGTEKYPASYLITAMLNGQMIEVRRDTGKLSDQGNPITERDPEATIAAQAKADIIQAKFKDWIWSDPERAARLSKYYNETFNSMKPRAFDGAHQTFPGMTPKWANQIHSHQKDAIWRVVQDRTALLAHEVGFGKTAVMVGAGMELRRLGLSRKNLFVVPKATHEQFKNQFKDIYPYANILFPNDDDFTEGKRGEFVARAATGDWDAIILADSQFSTIPVRPETEAKFLREEINALRDAIEDEEARSGRGKKSATSKDIEKSIEKAEVKLEDALDRAKQKHEHNMYFEDLGVDQMFVDEADAYKNLHFATSMGRLKGLPNSHSDRAMDMYMKTRTLQEQGKGQGVVFATGTPIANTVAEMYTMMRYLQEPMLEAKGLQHFDSWAKTFGKTEEGLEQNAAGKYVSTQRFKKFVNIPVLSNLWQQTADIRVADEVPSMRAQQPRIVNDKGEKTGRTVIAAPPDQALKDYMQELAVRADEMKTKDRKEDNMLKLSGDARKASLDMRMVKPNAPENPEGKVALAAQNVARIYKDTMLDKGTQLIFLDLGTPKASDGKDKPTSAVEGEDAGDEEEIIELNAAVLKDVYSHIKKLLIAQGVPENEIAFIHDAKTNQDKQRMYDKVNKGRVRVIIGSTGKLGTGVNIQERAAAIHHLDAPWRPRDIEQREGRIIRQGNVVYGPKKDENGKITNPGKGVRIYEYVTEGSFDAFMWQAIEAKARAIKSVMRRDTSGVTEIDDADTLALSAGQAKAIATGNPDVMKAVTLTNDIYKLGLLRGSHFDAKVRAENKLRQLPEQIAFNKTKIAKMERDAALVRPDDKFSFTVKGILFGEKDRAAAGDAMQSAISTAPKTEDAKSAPIIGNYKGFDIRAITVSHLNIPYTKLLLTSKDTGTEYVTTEMATNELTGSGAVTRVTNRVADISKEIERIKHDVAQDETNLTTYKKQAETPFVQEARLNAMIAELNRLNARLAGEKTPLNEEAIPIPADELLTKEPVEEPPEYHFAAKDMPEFKPAEIVEKPIEKPVPPIVEAVKPVPQPEVKPIEAPVKHIETDEELKARILKEQFPQGVPSETKPVMTPELKEKAIGAAMEHARADWQGDNITKHQEIKKAIFDVLKDEAETEELFNDMRLQSKYQSLEAYQNSLKPVEAPAITPSTGIEAGENKPKFTIKKAEIIPTETGGYVAVPIKKESEIEATHELVDKLRERADTVEEKAKELPPEQAKVVEKAVEAVREKADNIEATIPKTPMKRHHVVLDASKKKHTLHELKRINSERSPRSIAQDNAKKHHVVLEYKDAKVQRWLKDPGAADIIKVDTPLKHRNLLTPKPPKMKEKLVRTNVSGDNGLRSKRRGKIYETPTGRTVLLSRHPLGKRRSVGTRRNRRG